jgi:ribosome biogenesis protein ENP2
MQVTTTNDVKVYNLSAGRSLPEWISERKRRTLLKKDVGTAEIRNRVDQMCKPLIHCVFLQVCGGALN